MKHSNAISANTNSMAFARRTSPTRFCASYIKTEYADLTMKELACLVEYQIIDFLEDLLWGHRFEAVVKITPPDDFGWYCVYADISVLREDY